jgi:hypothetical protein
MEKEERDELEGSPREMRHGFKTIDSKLVWGVVPERRRITRK